MSFTAKDVQALRETTGAGMMDCKKALTETGGDMEKAVAFLREKGIAAAAKKASRIASEGIVSTAVSADGLKSAIIEVNSETDFVAKNEDFRKFVSELCTLVLDNNPKDLPELLDMKYPGTELTVADMQREKVLVIGENIQIRRFARLESGRCLSYTHMGGKIGVLVALDVAASVTDGEAVAEIGRNVAMQAASMRPKYLKSDEVPSSDIEGEREVLLAQAINEGKPQAVAEKIVAGRINKFYEDICLLNQPYVRENKLTVAQYVEGRGKELGGAISVSAFVRYETGEGLEKRSDDFAGEVAKMMG